MQTKELLLKLCEQDFCGGAGDAVNTLSEVAGKLASTRRLPDGSIVASIDVGADYTVCLEAHYDQIGFVVREVCPGGFLRVAAVGGPDKRPLPATRVKVYGKKVIPAVFTSVPPHLKKEENKAAELDEIYLDTGLLEGAEKVVSVGDIVVFSGEPVCLSEDIVTAKSIDNRAGCVALLKALEKLCRQKLSVNVEFLFADKEELGMRGAKTAAYTLSADEYIAVDVSFGDAPGIPPEKTGRIGGGAMICLSPTLTRSVCDGLVAAAQEVADWQYEVTGGRTGTDIDVMSLEAGGSYAGLVSVPLRNMHTGVELVSVRDIESVADLLAAYIMSHKGGADR